MFFNESFPTSKTINTKQCILNYTHTWSIFLGSNNLTRNWHNFFNLSFSFKRLRYMHIHFITIKISIVRCCYRKV